MTERSHPLLPLIWSSAAGPPAVSRPVALDVLLPAEESPMVAPLAGLYGLALRYGGPHDITIRFRSAATAAWRDLTISYPTARGSGPGPTLAACRDALRSALRSALAGQEGSGASFGSHSAGSAGSADDISYEVTAHVAADGDGAAAAADAPEDEAVFLFEREAPARWSVRLRSAATPTDHEAPGRVLAHLAAFVRACATAPQTRVGKVSYLSAAEMEVIEQVNDPPRVVSGAQCIHGLVEESAKRHPDNLAVVQGAERLTFRQLDQKANSLAADLIAAGVSRGDRVGILAARSAEFVVAALAVLKAGAAYVPLDPLLPAARLGTLFQIGAVRLLLAEHPAHEVATALTKTWMAIPPVQAMAALPAAEFRAPATRGEDLAYIIFTSGSSGTPKGVLLDHRGRVNLLTDLIERFGISSADRLLGVSSPSFDTSVLEIFGSLAAGAAIILPDRGSEYDVQHWARLVRSEGVTVWSSVPSSVTAFLRAWEQARAAGEIAPGPGPLRLFDMGGDWIPLDQPTRIWAAFPEARVYALGGNTEASVCTCIYPLTEVRPEWRSIPYGRALGGQTAYVLDAFGELAAPDQAGEVYFGGAGVGWGYDARPRLTAELFVPDRFGPVRGGRLYRTGDRAALRSGGFIELLGRVDQQVKIEGVRIELGEIQACLCRQPEVADGVVVPRRTSNGRVLSLVAFVVPAPAAAGTAAAGGGTELSLPRTLHERMEAELPRAMVPHRVQVLERLPVNANGKVDVKELEALASAEFSPASPEPGRRPGDQLTDEVVLAVAEAWSQVLDLDTLPGPDTIFADLGGGSLAAVQVAARLSTRFHADVKVAGLSATASVADVAAVVRERRRTARPVPDLVRRRTS